MFHSIIIIIGFQEGCAVGMSAVLKPDDAISCSHRNHAWAYLKGLTLHQIVAETTGKKFNAISCYIPTIIPFSCLLLSLFV